MTYTEWAETVERGVTITPEMAFTAGCQSEREECAKVCESYGMYGKEIPACGKVTQRSMNLIFKIAAAIRAIKGKE